MPCLRTHFPKRDELSLRRVLALPNASSRGLDSSTFCSTEMPPLPPVLLLLLAAVWEPEELPALRSPPREARQRMMSLEVSVLPAPLSPVICSQSKRDAGTSSRRAWRSGGGDAMHVAVKNDTCTGVPSSFHAACQGSPAACVPVLHVQAEVLTRMAWPALSLSIWW